jgi:hypothetical protein
VPGGGEDEVGGSVRGRPESGRAVLRSVGAGSTTPEADGPRASRLDEDVRLARQPYDHGVDRRVVPEGSDGLDLGSVLPYVKAVTAALDDPKPYPVSDIAPISRPFVGSLVTTYVVEVDAGLRFVSEHELNPMPVSADELHERAVQNLAAHVAKHHLRTPEYHAIRPVLLDGNFEVSVMFLDELWARFAMQFGESSILAVAPARDILARCPASSQEGRTQLGELIDRIWPNGDHLLTRDFYRRVDGTWQLA